MEQSRKGFNCRCIFRCYYFSLIYYLYQTATTLISQQIENKITLTFSAKYFYHLQRIKPAVGAINNQG